MTSDELKDKTGAAQAAAASICFYEMAYPRSFPRGQPGIKFKANKELIHGLI